MDMCLCNTQSTESGFYYARKAFGAMTHLCLPIVIQVICQTGVSLMSFGPGPGSKETAGRERERDREEFGP